MESGELNRIPVKVECHSGFKADEYPECFCLNDKRHDIEKILDPISANNVTLDLNGWRLGGLAAPRTTQATGISAAFRKNITVRNGTIRGFRKAVSLSDNSPYTTSQGHLVEEIRAEQNTYVGIETKGNGNIVRRCQIVDTGDPEGGVPSYGVFAFGPGTRVINNDVIGVTGRSNGVVAGVGISGANGAIVKQNRINEIATIGTGPTNGISIALSNNVTIIENEINNSGEYGIHFSASSGIYKDNVVNNATTAFSGGTAAGSTNYSN